MILRPAAATFISQQHFEEAVSEDTEVHLNGRGIFCLLLLVPVWLWNESIGDTWSSVSLFRNFSNFFLNIFILFFFKFFMASFFFNKWLQANLEYHSCERVHFYCSSFFAMVFFYLFWSALVFVIHQCRHHFSLVFFCCNIYIFSGLQQQLSMCFLTSVCLWSKLQKCNPEAKR